MRQQPRSTCSAVACRSERDSVRATSAGGEAVSEDQPSEGGHPTVVGPPRRTFSSWAFEARSARIRNEGFTERKPPFSSP